VNAEHPWKFTPSPGRITSYHPPGGPGIRVDTAAYADAVISPHYDSMIAKLIARGNTRAEVISRMQRALDSFVVEGIHTNLELQQAILRSPEFSEGRFDTGFMERFLAERRREAAAG
jgi:acetyl-CoA carboxylase biotin carboxylase subunit